MLFNARGDQVIPVARIVPQTIPTVKSAQETLPNPEEPLFACASKEDVSGDIILKVVNVFGVDQTMTVELTGANIHSVATGEVMAGQPGDINSVDNPFHTVPSRFIVTDASAKWTHTFPGNSITVIRFKTVL